MQIVAARGIEGVIFPVHRSFDPALLTPAWSDFALVGLGDCRLGDWIDIVCPDHCRNMESILQHLARHGCPRPGLALTEQFDAGSHGIPHGFFLRHQGGHKPGEVPPVCLLDETSPAKHAVFRQWLLEHEPAAVITTDAGLVARAREEGVQAVWLGFGSAAAPFDGGINDAAGPVAGAAVDRVVDKMRRFEKGMCDSPQRHFLKGVWMEPRAAFVQAAAVVA